jgi:RNA polymerase sigma-70 factor (ECF subfamily)
LLMMDAHRLVQLMDGHAAALVLYARQWCAVPDDVVQEAFFELSRLRASPEQPVAWLYKVVRNRALSAARAERRRRHHELVVAERTPAWFQPAEGIGLDARTVAEALQSLPPEQREPVVAHLWGGLSFEQIGTLMGSSASTAHRRYLAALQSLRQRLRVPCPNNPP